MDALSYAGKARDIIIIGYGASELELIMEKHAAKEDKYLAPDKAPEKGFFYRSDHISFAKKGFLSSTQIQGLICLKVVLKEAWSLQTTILLMITIKFQMRLQTSGITQALSKT